MTVPTLSRNFSRKSIFGGGGGHHSPIGGYLKKEDLVFVLHVNEKFGPWIIERERLFAAVDTMDGSKTSATSFIDSPQVSHRSSMPLRIKTIARSGKNEAVEPSALAVVSSGELVLNYSAQLARASTNSRRHGPSLHASPGPPMDSE